MTTAKYRVLWLSLARLTRHTGSAMCHTYGFFILYMFMKVTLNVYWIINALLFAPNRLFVIIYVCITIINDIVLTCLVCDNAQLVKRKVK
jgi:biotin transporter BioY